MQQVTRKTLGAGINLTCVTTPKFKRAVLRAMLVLPLGGEDAALRACLPQSPRLARSPPYRPMRQASTAVRLG